MPWLAENPWVHTSVTIERVRKADSKKVAALPLSKRVHKIQVAPRARCERSRSSIPYSDITHRVFYLLQDSAGPVPRCASVFFRRSVAPLESRVAILFLLVAKSRRA